MQTVEHLLKDRLVPVVVIDDVKHAEPLACALKEAGLNTMEITLRTDAGIGAIKAVASQTDLHVGAGTVLSVEDCKRAVDAGAQFIISPGTNEALIEYALEQKIEIFPGVCTPSDIDRARQFGLKILKFFPAEAAGGASFLKAISAPYANIQFIPTGGINPKNIDAYLKLPSVLACGASWFVEKALLNAEDWSEVKRRVRELAQLLPDHS